MSTKLNVLWTLVFLFSLSILNAQTFEANPWKEISKEKLAKSSTENRVIIPNKYRAVQVDWDEMLPLLAKAPLRFSDEAKMVNAILNLPMPNGETERFQVSYSPVMVTELALKYPEIKTFSGVGLDDPTATIKLDYTPKGFHAMIRSAVHNTVFIDPLSTDDNESHISYFKKDYQKLNAHFVCGFDEEVEVDNNAKSLVAGDCKLRTYRLALAATGEYSAFHGGTVAGVMAAYNVSMNRVNGIFEEETSLTMVLVANTDQLIFLNSNTDPYSNGNGGAMLGQNISTCNSVIGSANFDIGHVFSTGGGGVAYLNSPCGSNKAGGVTGQGSPVGDPFDVDYVAHEMGHQFGGGHTQNNSCNRSTSSSMEPGSASTIMGYAGICSPNVQNNSDAYFHAISIQQIASNTVFGSSSNCPQETITGNTAPIANAGSNYTIPVSTPFTLTGIASDPNGDVTTHNWDQMDATPATMPPLPTNTAGPAFRSVTPTTSKSRTFPNFAAVLNNTTPTWEVLPSVARTMNFRFQVRDNFAGAGCTDEDNMVVTVAGNAGPFTVISPNAGEVWSEAGVETVTWNVANTTASPVSCANVDILITTDGGLNFTTLATNVANDGTQQVTAPSVISSTARIMVVCSNNIFFDISDQNFNIEAGNNCPSFHLLSGTDSGTKEYHASGYVSSSTVITTSSGSSSDITYRAGNYIDLTAGFFLQPDNYFLAEIVPCVNRPSGNSSGGLSIELEQNENGVAAFNVTVPNEDMIKVSIIDVTGNEILTIIDNEKLQPGSQLINLEKQNIQSGLLFMKISSSTETKTVQWIN